MIDALSDLFILRGVPTHIRSDNGPEFIARTLRDLAGRRRRQDRLHKPGSPWENGYCEGFNSKLRDELPNGEIFYTLKGAKPSSRADGITTIRSGPTHRCDITRLHQRLSTGRLRNTNQLRRSPQR